ncbi:glycoside hydrolase family 2 TIM barrel-domain containing protein [Paenibacillus harenae]|uniref:glycoside hydrolase family 2 TIM barrel-domain containing protein n=1 Tax=Paenibacillus harenae TaxID=306543 RepID=UPI0027904E39|nr:glycoside hydrolase family 2 TIM barrel-domain containing protein [Paenibacillus harenae]MDQ0059210.1 beta-galactosidase [Paenibacillus harenae]
MKATKASLDWLSDVAVFAVNRLPAHSDHNYYATLKEAQRKESMPWRHSLNGAWKFNYAANPASRPVDFYKTSFSCEGWNYIEVPGHIQLQGYGQPQYVNTMYPWDGHEDLRPPQISSDHNPVGSYATSFEVPGNMAGKPLFISFQGVETAFYVWLNGEFVGYGEDSFTPSEFELTPFVKEGDNKLAVEVYQRSTGSWLEDQDFWRFSGIFRDVYLYTVPEVHAQDVSLRMELNDSYDNGSLNVSLAFRSVVPSGTKAVLDLYDASGVLIVSEVIVLDGLESERTSLQVKNPSLWSAERPYLYSLYIRIVGADGNEIEVIPQRVGFRRFEMEDKIMKLNGKRVVFKGVNRHEFNSRRGRAITNEDMLWDIKALKRNNINAVRTSHYPNQSYWYELCDEYGVYVIDEMNLETHGSWQKMGAVEPSWNIPGSKPEWQDIVMDRAISLYERDKNHPSVIIWSLGNESYVGDVLVNVARYFRTVDPSRLVHYEGVFYDRAFTEASDMESRMYAKVADIEEYLNNDPDKPYISCEYMHAMGNSLGGMRKYTDLEQKYPMYQGGFIWDYIDQVIVKENRYGDEFLAYGGDFDDRPTDYNFCTNGIVYANRELSPKMQDVKFLYQNVKLAPERDGLLIRNDNLFEDTGAFALEIALFREGIEVHRFEVEAAVAAGNEARIAYNIEEQVGEPGEYAVHASLKLKQATLWAEEGYEIAFGEHIFKVAGQAVDAAAAHGKLRVANGDVNIGVHGRNFRIMFSKQAHTMTSIVFDGREMIAAPPVPLFWRATTDNDKGYSQGFDSGLWYAASLTRKSVGIDVSEAKDGSAITVAYRFRFSISETAEAKIAYTVNANGSVRVQAEYKGAPGLPRLPIFAVSFKVKADYDQLEWYAMGPEENYADRANGARLCVFENTAADNVAAYAVPQESGNRTGVRRLSVRNRDGHGLRIVSSGEPVECNVSPYTAFELENAQHHYELPEVHYTVITVAGRQMGVGGDDSWGAPVHEEYTISGEQDLAFEFTIERA